MIFKNQQLIDVEINKFLVRTNFYHRRGFSNRNSFYKESKRLLDKTTWIIEYDSSKNIFLLFMLTTQAQEKTEVLSFALNNKCCYIIKASTAQIILPQFH